MKKGQDVLRAFRLPIRDLPTSPKSVNVILFSSAKDGNIPCIGFRYEDYTLLLNSYYGLKYENIMTGNFY